ncbi:MAG: hypothetical protein P8188_20235 [Gemmatimonadota bacterium]
MKRPGAASIQVPTRSGVPLNTPITFRLSMTSMVRRISSSSLSGDQTGSSQGGSFNIVMKVWPYGAAGSHAGNSSIGVHMATGGGPC